MKLRSARGEVVVDISAGSVLSPVLLRYQEISPSGIPNLPNGYQITGRFFELPAEPAGGQDSQIRLQQKLSITVGIETYDLELSANDFTRFALHHYLGE